MMTKSQNQLQIQNYAPSKRVQDCKLFRYWTTIDRTSPKKWRWHLRGMGRRACPLSQRLFQDTQYFFFRNRSTTMANNPDDRNDDTDDETPQLNDGRYAIDIRVFLAIISLTMAASFFAGVAMLPLPNTTAAVLGGGMTQAGGGGRPKVNSNVMNSSGIPKDLDDLHLPAGQHLLVDIRNVEAAFLNSESRLADAMVQTVRESGYVNTIPYAC
jgi:hypothetical protein